MGVRVQNVASEDALGKLPKENGIDIGIGLHSRTIVLHIISYIHYYEKENSSACQADKWQTFLNSFMNQEV